MMSGSAKTPPTLTASDGDFGPPSEGAPTWGVSVLCSPDGRAVGGLRPIGGRLVVGRAPGSQGDFTIDDPRLSREHAAVFGDDEHGYYVEDCNSRNGTFVDGLRQKRCMLRPGALIRMGETLLEFTRLESPAPEAAAPSQVRANEAIVGRSPKFRAALADAARVARASIPVLLVGETGTGKDVMARHIHELSGCSGELVAVNCGALPSELIESSLFGHRKGAFTGAVGDAAGFFSEAQGGTLFLDEIGELPLIQQAKLLRVLENREYVPLGTTKVVKTDARIIAATNADLHQAVANGRFRNDLYARLAGTIIDLPPLRSRRGDIPMLAARFFAELAPGRQLVLPAAVLERLVLAPWPRNIRELRATVHRLTLIKSSDGEITFQDLEPALATGLREPPATPQRTPPPGGPGPGPRAEDGARPMSSELVAMLELHGGNISKVAEHYGKDAKQIYRWLKRYGLDADSFRRR